MSVLRGDNSIQGKTIQGAYPKGLRWHDGEAIVEIYLWFTDDTSVSITAAREQVPGMSLSCLEVSDVKDGLRIDSDYDNHSKEVEQMPFHKLVQVGMDRRSQDIADGFPAHIAEKGLHQWIDNLVEYQALPEVTAKALRGVLFA